jgi:hypothetical protein
MSSSRDKVSPSEGAPGGVGFNAALVREAGVPFQPLLNSDAGTGIDPIAEWLSLMKVVQMLCPTWPVRDKPMHGNHWRL